MSALSEQKADISVTEQKGPPQANTAMKQEPVSLSSIEAPIPNQNGTNGQGSVVIDLSKPVRTDAQASVAENSFISRSLQLTPTSSPAISSPITPFAPNLGSLSSQLTPDEQTAAYKKANILALSALAKKGGPNTKDIFAAQQKLQEFLTSLITLAGQKGPQLKVTVQMLVQNLVTGQMTEEEFATRIESDLRSKHQPSLLPFLKDSVPHLKARLQLQQVIMKELLQKMIAEKRNVSPASVPASTSAPEPSPPNPPQSVVSAPQTITAVQVAPVATSTSAAGPPPGAKPTTVAASKVTVGSVIPSSTSGQQLQLSQTFSQAAFESLSQQLPKVLRDKIIKLPKEQQKFVYMHQLRQMQQLQGQQRQQSKPLVASPKVVLEKQQRLVQEQQVPMVVGGAKSGGVARGVAATASVGSSTADGKGKANFAAMKIVPGSSPGPSSSASRRKGKAKDTGPDIAEEEEEVVGMDLLDQVGVNLQEETAQFMPQQAGTATVARSCKDTVFLNLPNLRRRVESIMRANGVQEVGEEALVLLSHATQERMKDVVEKLTEISQHRVQVLKDDSNYHVKSEVRGQLRVLEAIDRIAHKRKQEREHEQMLKAAKSRSKGADPEKAAKIREEAKQHQLDEAARIRNERANQTALAAIGRKRAFPPSGDDSGGGGSSADIGNNSAVTSSLFAPLASTRSPKRHMTIRDFIFYMEQERESRKSLALYKALMK